MEPTYKVRNQHYDALALFFRQVIGTPPTNQVYVPLSNGAARLFAVIKKEPDFVYLQQIAGAKELLATPQAIDGLVAQILRDTPFKGFLPAFMEPFSI